MKFMGFTWARVSLGVVRVCFGRKVVAIFPENWVAGKSGWVCVNFSRV